MGVVEDVIRRDRLIALTRALRIGNLRHEKSRLLLDSALWDPSLLFPASQGVFDEIRRNVRVIDVFNDDTLDLMVNANG